MDKKRADCKGPECDCNDSKRRFGSNFVAARQIGVIGELPSGLDGWR